MSIEALNAAKKSKEEILKRIKGSEIHIVYKKGKRFTTVSVVGTSRQITNPILEFSEGTIETIADQVRERLIEISAEAFKKRFHFYSSREAFLNRKPTLTLDPPKKAA